MSRKVIPGSVRSGAWLVTNVCKENIAKCKLVWGRGEVG